MLTPTQLENRQVNCPNDVVAQRIKMMAMAKRKWGGVIPEEVLDELLPA
jgi:hypothetical protein